MGFVSSAVGISSGKKEGQPEQGTFNVLIHGPDGFPDLTAA
jgi:hypothetical protein